LIGTYKKNAQNRDALVKRSEKQIEELVRLAKPVAYTIVLRRPRETVPAELWTLKAASWSGKSDGF
jgi:hypothetical protein